MNTSANYILFIFILNGVIAFCTINMIVAVLPSEDYKIYSSMVSGVALISAVFFQWLRVYALRELVVDFELQVGGYLKKLQRTIFIFLLAALPVLLIVDTNYKKYIYYCIAVIFMVFGQGLYEISLALWRSGGYIKEFFWFSVIRATVWLACVFLGWYMDMPIYFFLLAMALSFLLGAFGVFKKFGNVPVSEVDARKRWALDYTFNVSFSVVLGFLVIYIFKVFCVDERVVEAGSALAWFDLLYLICITPFLASNYMYQTRMVEMFTRNINFDKYALYVLLSCVMAMLAAATIYLFALYSFVSLPEINIEVLIAMTSSLIILGIKQNWLDHAYYLNRGFIKHWQSLVFSIIVTVTYVLLPFDSNFLGVMMVYSISLVSYVFIAERRFVFDRMAGRGIFLLCFIVAVPGVTCAIIF